MQQVSSVMVDNGQVSEVHPASPPQRYGFAFHGTGGPFFVLILKNVLLTLVTFGIYAAWAKTERRKYMWQNTEFHGQRFIYHGTGQELFIGYLKVLLGYGVFVGVPALGRALSPELGVALTIVLTLALVFLIPFAIYWSRAYLLSRTSWRGVRFSLEPGAKPYAKAFIGGYLLTLVTLGLFAPIWLNRLHKLMTERTRFGDASFRYTGDDGEVWRISVRGWIFTLLTLGIYFFWYRAELTRYQLEHTHFGRARGSSTLTGGELLGVGLTYIIGTTFTFGLAFPWLACHLLSTVLSRVSLTGNIDFARIVQAPVQANAAGDGLADAMDVGLSL